LVVSQSPPPRVTGSTCGCKLERKEKKSHEDPMAVEKVIEKKLNFKHLMPSKSIFFLKSKIRKISMILSEIFLEMLSRPIRKSVTRNVTNFLHAHFCSKYKRGFLALGGPNTMAVGRMEPLAAALEPGGWLGARRVVHRGIIASAARQAAARTRAGPRHVPPPLPPRDASAPRAHRSHAAGPSILRPGTPLSRPMPAAKVEEAWAQQGRPGGWAGGARPGRGASGGGGWWTAARTGGPTCMQAPSDWPRQPDSSRWGCGDTRRSGGCGARGFVS
jgi:hypothetical protein